MAKSKEHHFDVSAKLDMQEMKNAITQAKKEVENRYDFKGVKKDIDLNEKGKVITVITSSEPKIDAIIDILLSKLSKRDIPLNALEELSREDSSGGNRKVIFKIIDSIEKDEAKKITTEIKKLKLKVTATNQGDEIRVSGKKLDDLQTVMSHLKSLDLKAPLIFDNFR